MSKQFTPGEWKQSPLSGGAVISPDAPNQCPTEVEYYGGKVICETCGSADMALIVASKKLYEACKNLLSRDPNCTCPLCTQARAAIAEAEKGLA